MESINRMNQSSHSFRGSQSSLRILLMGLFLVVCMTGPTKGFSTPSIPSRRVTSRTTLSTPNTISPSSSSSMMSTTTLSASVNNRRNHRGPRAALRGITGFSWTACRATLRAATGISLTAVYATTLAVSGQWIRQTMRVLLSILPPGARYFVQPLLVLYYAPLFILKSRTGPPGQRKRDVVVEGWKEAVEVADGKSEVYWPPNEE